MEYTVHFGEETLKELKSAISGVEVEELNVTANGSYNAGEGKAFNPVNVNVSGGGGGDFSTAVVTVVIGNDVRLRTSEVFENLIVPFNEIVGPAISPLTLILPLYINGSILMLGSEEVPYSFTDIVPAENAEELEEGVYIIKGDVTLTFIPEQ